MTIKFYVKGKECLIDDIDADLLESLWHPLHSKGSNTIYLRRSFRKNGVRFHQQMHRVILGRALERDLEPHELVDHEDLNGLNNQRSNLRIATSSQNYANRTVQANNALQVKGVRRRYNGKYEARISFNREKIYLGVFDTPEEAHAVYLAKAKELYGDFARGE